MQKQEEDEAKVLAEFEETFGVDTSAAPESKLKPARANRGPGTSCTLYSVQTRSADASLQLPGQVGTIWHMPTALFTDE